MQLRNRLIGAIWFLQVANYFDRTAIGFAGPAMMKSMSMGPGAFGLVLSSFSAGYLLAQMPGGALADRWGARRVLLCAPVLWAVFTGATALAAGMISLLLLRACLGLSEGVSNGACYKLIGDHFPSRERSRATALWGTAFAVAPALAGPLVGGILRVDGWRMAFAALTIPALLAAVINGIALPRRRAANEPRQASAAEQLLSLRRLFWGTPIWLISSAYCLFNIAYWGLLGWMPSFLALQRHLDLSSSALLSGIPYAFAFLGLIVLGWLGSSGLSRHRAHILAGAYLSAGAALYLASACTTLFSSLAALSASAFFLYGGLGVFGAVVLELAPVEHRAAYSAFVSTVGQIGGIIAPAVIGVLRNWTGSFTSGFALMTASLIAAALCILALAPAMSTQTGPAAVRLAPK
jgi:MFS family permease